MCVGINLCIAYMIIVDGRGSHTGGIATKVPHFLRHAHPSTQNLVRSALRPSFFFAHASEKIDFPAGPVASGAARSDGHTADSGDLFVSMNGLVVYLMFLFCVVWLTKDFTLSQENVKLCLKHYPWSKKYIPRCLMRKKKKAGFADRLISSMTWEQAKNLKTEDWTGA